MYDTILDATAFSKSLKNEIKHASKIELFSAFIKSIRGSDPNAAVYWLARMIEGGEEVKFIARRMLILAAEDKKAASG